MKLWRRRIFRLIVWGALSLAGAALAQGPARGHGQGGSGGPGVRIAGGEGRMQRMMPDRFVGDVPAGKGSAETSRLSPEERRQLRQDIHQAGREFYPGRGDGQRRGPGR